jgi:hypothetical protein
MQFKMTQYPDSNQNLRNLVVGQSENPWHGRPAMFYVLLSKTTGEPPVPRMQFKMTKSSDLNQKLRNLRNLCFAPFFFAPSRLRG